ncbi:MAG: efflux RND transporter permease subunit, partial [Gammaproteobacteria bacterium]|nr:efflux RND transporter permease subunit [Gammaproteobacteria bacterium]
QDVAEAVRRASLDLSAGSIDTRDAQVRIRTLGQRHDQQDFEAIVLLAREDGTAIRLGDVADVRDGFENSNLIVRHQGKPAIFVEVSRADGEQVMDVAAAVHEHIANTIVPSLPDGVGVTIWNDDSQSYSERLDLLLKNGLLGLGLVIVALALFLEIRLAFWVVVGLLTAGVGALAVMLAFDLAINTISLFSFVLAIGIIVDDAIVVAEHIHQERMRGTPGMTAAIRGTRRIRGPLTFAVLTSVAAFVPLLYIPGGIGEVWTALPVIIIGMLLISLVESLFILPSHLSRLHGPEWTPTGRIDRFFANTQALVDRRLEVFLSGPLHRALQFATHQPAIVVAGVIGLFVFSVSLVPAGVVPTTFADVVEGDFVTANLEMPEGTTAERTFEVATELEQAGRRVLERLSREQGDGGVPLLAGVTVTVGQEPRVEGGGLNPAPTLNPRANIATVELKLVSAQQRDISTIAAMQAWRDEVGTLPYARGISFTGEVIDLGSPVEAVLSHPDSERLNEIADSVVDGLRSVGGVFDIRSDHAPGVKEVQLALRPEARTLGVTVEGLAGQARA